MKKYIIFFILLIFAGFNVLFAINPGWKIVDKIKDDYLIDLKCADSLNCIVWVETGFSCLYGNRFFHEYYLRRTSDGGLSWKNIYQSEKCPPNLFAISYPSPNLFIAVGDSGFMIRTTDKGETWQKNLWPSDTGFWKLQMLMILFVI